MGCEKLTGGLPDLEPLHERFDVLLKDLLNFVSVSLPSRGGFSLMPVEHPQHEQERCVWDVDPS